MNGISVETPSILVLAEGDSIQACNNTRGHLFEEFVALLFSYYGYETPRRSRLNVTANGVELDVSTTHEATRQPAIAECKSYSRNLGVDDFNKFYGKLVGLRFGQPELFGWFVAIPGLTPEAHEQARLFMGNDPKFRLLLAEDIVDLLRSKSLIRNPSSDLDAASDFAICITANGIFSIIKELDPKSGRPKAVRIWGMRSPPDPVIKLVFESDYAGGLDVIPDGVTISQEPVPTRPEPTIVEVSGSSSDFEYQYPASPEHFVGRDPILQEFTRIFASQLAKGKIVVLNAQSGWGKSSLALQLRRLVLGVPAQQRLLTSTNSRRSVTFAPARLSRGDPLERGGYALVVDTRTASSPDYVWEVLRRLGKEAEQLGILTLPVAQAYSSLASTLRVFANAKWEEPKKPLLVFFDQFENVFRDQRLTQEFRDFALATADLNVPIVVGFAWKTDLISFTEDHPYRARDDIRDRSSLILVRPFGPKEISNLLGRLEKAAGVKLGYELRQRLREYSQGFPWLFKKLASHILHELMVGTSREALLAESLNVQSLFESDLAELGPQEHEGLKLIARSAPVLVSDAVEYVSREIIQILVDRRLIVQVGERLDTYWDIFRDFLNTGQVPIQETYILRQTPYTVAKLIKIVVEGGGEIAVSEAALRLRTSDAVIANLSREFRSMGVLEASSGILRLASEIKGAEALEAAIHDRISSALRRHRTFSILSRKLDEFNGAVPVPVFAEAIPEAYPAVSAKQTTWLQYARAFAHWFHYARLATLSKDVVHSGPPQAEIELLKTRTRLRAPRSFPVSSPGPALSMVATLAGKKEPILISKKLSRALHDLVILGIAQLDDFGGVFLAQPELITGDKIKPEVLRDLLSKVPGGREALNLLEAEPNASPMAVGSLIKDAYNADWAEGTVHGAGKAFRAWARKAGVRTTIR